ncbi:MAG TPA: TetR family transcriptional regulator [Polyangiaceae bacterium]|jgi:AcrR family transcriptional regulator
MKDRRDKILDVAVALAEEGGFENVRQRDVAANAGVALGTLYKRFRSKEEILCAALEREAELLERRMETNPATGKAPIDRVGSFFTTLTRGMMKKPKFSRAVLRAMASGEEGVAKTVVSYQGRITGLIIAAMRGVGRLSFADASTKPPTEKELQLTFLLQQIWFASLVGWSAGIVGPNDVVEQVKNAAMLISRGMDAKN